MTAGSSSTAPLSVCVGFRVLGFKAEDLGFRKKEMWQKTNPKAHGEDTHRHMCQAHVSCLDTCAWVRAPVPSSFISLHPRSFFSRSHACRVRGREQERGTRRDRGQKLNVVCGVYSAVCVRSRESTRARKQEPGRRARGTQSTI